MKYIETECKSMLVKSRLPDTDYVINPYTGCEFGCSYCYASFMGRFVGQGIERWGDYVFVKTNGVEVLSKELRRLSQESRQKTILLSSVTDAWQGAERKYRISRGVIEQLVQVAYPGSVSILTKSPIILDDAALIARLPRAEVGVTVTSTDDALSRLLEVRAPSASRRIHTLEQLNRHGIKTYAFVGPLLPHFRYLPDKLDELFARIADTGTREVYVELVNASRYIRTRLDSAFGRGDQWLRSAYAEVDEQIHRAALADIVTGIVQRRGLVLRLGRVIDHRQEAGKTRTIPIVRA